MAGFGKIFLTALAVLAAPAWLFQRWLEANGLSDQPGRWYTIWCAAAWATAGAVLAAATSRILRRR